MKRYITFLLITLPLMSMAQTNEIYTPVYEIGDYLINPTEKTVSVKQFTSGYDYDDKGQILTDWWGHKYVPDTTIVYDTIYYLYWE